MGVLSTISRFFSCARPQTSEDTVRPEIPPSVQPRQPNQPSNKGQNTYPGNRSRERQVRADFSRQAKQTNASEPNNRRPNTQTRGAESRLGAQGVSRQGRQTNASKSNTSFDARPITQDDDDPLSTFKNNGRGRVAVFGKRCHPITREPIALLAPFPLSYNQCQRQLELAGMPSFVCCADNTVRRFPPAMGTGANSASQIKAGWIYDAPQESIDKHIAGFRFRKADKQGAFEVNGREQAPIFKGHGLEIYKLDKNLHMIPQPDFQSCSFACENMLLMDRGHLTVDALEAGKAELISVSRREDDKLIESLKEKTGITPIVFEEKIELKKNDNRSIDKLQKLIQKHGSCILGTDGHARMLDEIRKENGEYLFTIRDPFHGSCNVIKGKKYALADYEESKNPPKHRVVVKAVFLPSKSSEATANSSNAHV